MPMIKTLAGATAAMALLAGAALGTRHTEGRGRMEGFPWMPNFRPDEYKALTAYLLGTAAGADAEGSGEFTYNHTGYYLWFFRDYSG